MNMKELEAWEIRYNNGEINEDNRDEPCGEYYASEDEAKEGLKKLYKEHKDEKRHYFDNEIDKWYLVRNNTRMLFCSDEDIEAEKRNGWYNTCEEYYIAPITIKISESLLKGDK